MVRRSVISGQSSGKSKIVGSKEPRLGEAASRRILALSSQLVLLAVMRRAQVSGKRMRREPFGLRKHVASGWTANTKAGTSGESPPRPESRNLALTDAGTKSESRATGARGTEDWQGTKSHNARTKTSMSARSQYSRSETGPRVHRGAPAKSTVHTDEPKSSHDGKKPW